LRRKIVLFSIDISDNLATKHDVVVDVVEQHNRNQNPNKGEHKHQRTGGSSGLVDGDLSWNDIGEEIKPSPIKVSKKIKIVQINGVTSSSWFRLRSSSPTSTTPSTGMTAKIYTKGGLNSRVRAAS